MPRLSLVLGSVLGAWLLGPATARAADGSDFDFYHENVMGTSLELRVRADGPETARWAEDRVLREIDRLSAIFSGYDPASEFRRWQAQPLNAGPVNVSPELFEVLQASDDWRARSGGAFDPRVEALTRLWTRCAREDRVPTAAERADAKALMSAPAWRLDPATGTALRLSDCPLTLNAIAKGDIVERAGRAALDPGRERGVRGLLLNVGGDLRAWGEPARTIGIVAPDADSESSPPLAFIEVRDKAVATSGRSQRGLRINGKWYSHIFDPRSGAPVEGVAQATVVAGRSAAADALATIFNVLSPEESLRLAATLPDVECLIVTADGRVVRSEGWHRLERQRPALALADGPEAKKEAVPAANPWAHEFELAIDFEINRPEAASGRYRRPYVAVWVEDKNGFPVRALALWVSFGGAGPYQWLPDLKHWYRSDKARRVVDKTNMIDTIARPTRPPGKYSLVWDGKDDRGKPLDRGDYTIFIDAAREHGTYQSIRKPVTLGDAPFTEPIAGGTEIKSATIEYRRKPAVK